MEKAFIPMRSIYDFDNAMGATSASEIDELADRCQSLEQRIASLNDSYETLKKRQMELTEWRWVLREAGGFFDRVCVGYGSPLKCADKDIRPEDRLTRSGNQWTRMTTLPCYQTSSSTGQTVVMEVAARFQL